MNDSERLKIAIETLTLIADKDYWLGQGRPLDAQELRILAKTCLEKFFKIQSPDAQVETRVAREFYLVDATDNSGWHVRSSMLGIVGCNVIKVREVIEGDE